MEAVLRQDQLGKGGDLDREGNVQGGVVGGVAHDQEIPRVLALFGPREGYRRLDSFARSQLDGRLQREPEGRVGLLLVENAFHFLGGKGDVVYAEVVQVFRKALVASMVVPNGVNVLSRCPVRISFV